MVIPNLMKLIDNEDELFHEQGQEPSRLQTHHLWVGVSLAPRAGWESEQRESTQRVAVFMSTPGSLRQLLTFLSLFPHP